ncbi:MAG: DUF5696 domain-containing protein [Thermoanaerobaculia bacterium]
MTQTSAAESNGVWRGPLRRLVLGLALVCAWAAPLAAVDFSYRDGADEIAYRYTPDTGTLSDLQVLRRGAGGELSFHPAFGGGITQFSLAGEIVEVADARHRVVLLKEKASASSYKAKFRWRFNRERFDFTVEIRLNGRALELEYRSDSSAVILFDLVRSEGTPQPRIVDLPYGHKVLFSEGLFTSALIDPRRSNASEIWPTKHYVSPTSASFAPWAFYRRLTDGERNPLRESVRIVTSPRIQDTFFLPDNPVSPYREKLSKYVIVDLWRRSFAAYLADLEQLAARGFQNLFAIVHIWQRFGYDNGLPTTTPPSREMGGKAGMKEISQLARDNGYLFSLHTNYVDFYPNSRSWTPRHLALSSEGQPIEAWNSPRGGQSFLMKPSKAQRYARRFEPILHEKYKTSAGYLDVHSAIIPSMKVDFDASVRNAGRQSATFEHYRELMAYLRREHQGPVAGEGKGGSSAVWAGYIDAVEADPRSLHQEIENVNATRTPAIVDYKLRVLHHLYVPHGVGYFSRFFRKKSSYSTEQFRRYLASEIAFGNAGFIGRTYFDPLNVPELERKYAFMTLLQPEYLGSEATEIAYRVNGRWLGLSGALRSVLPTIAAKKVDRRLAERLGILRVRYDSGFEVVVNRSLNRTFETDLDGTLYQLEASDFVALKCGRVIAHSARVAGERSEFVAGSAGVCG